MTQLSPEQQKIASDVQTTLQKWNESYAVLAARVRTAPLEEVKTSLAGVKATDLAKSYKELFNAMSQNQTLSQQLYTQEATLAFNQSKGLLAVQSGD